MGVGLPVLPMSTPLAMLARLDPVQAAAAEQAFAVHRRSRLLVALRWACVACIAVLAAFALFDSFWAIDGLQGLLVARSASLAALLLVLLASWTPLGVRHVDALSVLCCLSFCGGAVVIAELAGSGLSIYRDPIYLGFMLFTLLVPWRPRAAALCYFASVGMYDGLYFFMGGMGYMGSFVMSNALLAAGALIATYSVRFLYLAQRSQYFCERQLQQLLQAAALATADSA